MRIADSKIYRQGNERRKKTWIYFFFFVDRNDFIYIYKRILFFFYFVYSFAFLSIHLRIYILKFQTCEIFQRCDPLCRTVFIFQYKHYMVFDCVCVCLSSKITTCRLYRRISHNRWIEITPSYDGRNESEATKWNTQTKSYVRMYCCCWKLWINGVYRMFDQSMHSKMTIIFRFIFSQ